MSLYSVKKLAKLAGVSVRTLHHYDRMGLLKPSVRTEARYRLYGENELLRLQQILFYKELDFSLHEIHRILTDPAFDVLTALQSHRLSLETRRDRLTTLLTTIDKTMSTLKGESVMLSDAELYEGFSKEQAEAYRREAVAKYGAETIEASENELRSKGKERFAQLKAESEAVTKALVNLMNQDPTSSNVQQQVARHYALIRQFWGESVCADKDMAEAYKGLGQLYVDDLRYTVSMCGQENPSFATFMNKAMVHFADTQIK